MRFSNQSSNQSIISILEKLFQSGEKKREHPEAHFPEASTVMIIEPYKEKGVCKPICLMELMQNNKQIINKSNPLHKTLATMTKLGLS